MPKEIAMTTFEAAVDAIRQHRLANHSRFPILSTDSATIAAQLDEYTCIRIAQDPQWCTGKAAQTSALPKGFRLAHLRPVPSANVAGVVSSSPVPKSYIRNTAAGIGLYLDWFGDRKPVDQLTAEKRAGVCVTCPKHVKGNLMQRFNAAAAKEIMSVFSILTDLSLKTSRDGDLAICDACDCPMRAKVWSPIGIIRKHIRPEAEAALWENCWIRSEPNEAV